MTQVRAAIPLVLLMAVTVSGCLGGDSEIQDLDVPVTIAPGITNVSGEIRFDHGDWTVGDWWETDLKMDLGFNFLLETQGKLVVSPSKGDGYVLATDTADFGIFDGYFDSFYQGAFDIDLNPTVFGKKLTLYQWPLKEGLTWTTPFIPESVFSFNTTTATLRVETFEDQEANAPPRLRIQGETADGASVDYDYDPATGWMTYFRLTNKTTGRIALSLDVRSSGQEFHGDLHRYATKEVYAAFKLMPPFDPSLTPVPDVVDVPKGFAFIEFIRFAGVYTLEGPVGAGAAAVTIIHPDGQADITKSEGALEFHGAFERNHLEPYKEGKYEVLYALAGTSFGFCLIMGFNDDPVTL